MSGGSASQSSVSYVPNRLNIDLPFPTDATDVVFDANRPYLSCVTAGTTDATLALFAKELAASGWSPLTAADAAGRWPNATLDDGAANGAHEIKIPPFAEPQLLEAGVDVSGLPTPKRAISSGGSSSRRTQIALVALVPAEVSTVLAFYRRELASRNFEEQSTGANLDPDQALLTFASPDGTIALKLDHKYDLTSVTLVLKVSEAVWRLGPKRKKTPTTSS